ncbi:MAG: hypothetical protein CMB80_16025 [Flammeovirgaceae bacterium]|nr:hypothetical protein [Flammeovirgaceae bacterium]HCX23281.1 hypothetical protein [Cytophagales bacterium]|tara:strand:+ start:1212 stop:1709 length:498 start_codon:yes stop_codon:yes gene_type:complete
MKRFTQLLTALVICSLVIFVSCKKKKGSSDPDPRDEFGSVLDGGSWVPSAVTFDNANRTEWDGFVLGFNYNTDTNQGTYSTSGIPTDDGASDVWGTGTVSWEFGGTEDTPDIGEIIRVSDGVVMDVTPDNPENPTQLIIQFSVEDPSAGRVDGFYGSWSFTLVKQ